MSVRTIAGSDWASFPFPLPEQACAVPEIQADAREAEEFPPEEDSLAEEIHVTAGCMRGVRWALGLEAAAAVLVYGIWQIVRIWR